MAGPSRRGEVYRCQWCRTPLPHAFAKCAAPDCDRPPGFQLMQHVPGRFRGKSRCYVLTPLGWETAGYALVGDRWMKVEGGRRGLG